MRLEGQVGITAAVRQTRLRPECARSYPTIPVSMWTSARHLAALVSTALESLPRQLGKCEGERALPEADFEFRGGFPRLPDVLPLRTRAGESAVR